MRVVSWNVNGLRAAWDKGFARWLVESNAHVVGLQEVRAHPEQLAPDIRAPSGWHSHFVAAERPGYSGVGLYAKTPPDEVQTSLGVRTFDVEGRVQMARFGRLWLCNVYFPNGNGPDRDNSRVPYKLRFYRKLFRVLEPRLAAGEPVLVMGDFNTAHEEIDLARPKTNQKTSGFLPTERRELARWLRAGWVDTFRAQEPSGGHYTWWSQRFGVRERNVGWRIDYVLASPHAAPYVRRASIHPEILGSDHCPVSVDLDDAVLAPSPRKETAAR